MCVDQHLPVLGEGFRGLLLGQPPDASASIHVNVGPSRVSLDLRTVGETNEKDSR